ncbi:MAG: transcriptional regulator [Deltaproteobacteria bacterium]|nr:transcriptional regulator [Deltaproteobacteria bacterium]
MRVNADQRRSGCPISCSLDLLGDKWSLLIVRDMVFGRKRYFKEFLASPEGIATNILTDRLKRLEDCGIISKLLDPENKRQIVYTLTEKGIALIPVLVELLCWGATYDSASNFDLDKVRQIQQDTRSRQRFLRELEKRCTSPS